MSRDAKVEQVDFAVVALESAVADVADRGGDDDPAIEGRKVPCGPRW